MKHTLIPKHEIMEEEEVEKLLERYQITKDKLPRILQTDPAIEEMEPKLGDVIKITRYEHEIGKTPYYRLVIRD